MLKNIGYIEIIESVLFVAIGLLSAYGLKADAQEPQQTSQYYAPVLTGAPLLTMTPDARSAGMAGVGVTTVPSGASLYHNTSLMAQISPGSGVSLHYTPWMPDVAKDMSLSSIYGYYSWKSLSSNLRYTIAGGFRYFNIGATVAFPKGSVEGVAIHPYELAFNAGFALGFNEYWSVGLALGYLYSDYNYSLNEVKGNTGSILVDLSGTYQSPELSFSKEIIGKVKAGLSLNNIGGKLTYDGGATTQFLPTVLKLGQGVDLKLQGEHGLGIYLEESKVIAPTLPLLTDKMEPEEIEQVRTEYAKKSSLGVLISSWGDAPGGFVEELKEIQLALGAEYRYRTSIDFALRLGSQYQNKEKGTGTGLTIGAGVGYQKAKLDLSYFVASDNKSPLNNTFRISLGIDF